MKLVVANGCFDGLHAGHLRLLEFASRQGDRLVVLLNSDASVRALKGPRRPIHSFDERLDALSLVVGVDAVVLGFGELTARRALEILRPAVLVKGVDVPRPWPGEEFAGECRACPMLAGISTTIMHP
ncbi:MAG: adenylyltransferase/cytidyltransferase family protein [Candidatus Dormibacteria bacterium]